MLLTCNFIPDLQRGVFVKETLKENPDVRVYEGKTDFNIPVMFVVNTLHQNLVIRCGFEQTHSNYVLIDDFDKDFYYLQGGGQFIITLGKDYLTGC